MLLTACSFFRSEGLLLGLALAAAIGVVGLRRRRIDLVVAGVVIVVSSAVTTYVDRWWLGRILGGSTVPLSTLSDGFLQSRLSAAATTFLLPGATWPPYAYYGLVAVLIGVISTALIVRRRPVNATLLKVGSVVVVVGAVALLRHPGHDQQHPHHLPDPRRRVAPPVAPRPGQPRSSGGRRRLHAVRARRARGAVRRGWRRRVGARFLALLLPVAVPIALLRGQAHGPCAPTPDRRWPAVALTVATLSMVILSVTSLRLRYYRGIIVEWNDLVRQAEQQATGPDLGDGDRRPIVVTTWSGLGRMTWPLDPTPRGLTLPQGAVTDYAHRLHDHGVDEFVLATEDPKGDLAALQGIYEPVVSLPNGPVTKGPVFVMRAV